MPLTENIPFDSFKAISYPLFKGGFMGIVIQNKKLKPEHYMLSVSLPGHQLQPSPGQFCMLSCGPTTDPLLRRPLSIHDYSPQKAKNPPRVDFLYRVVGTGTRLLSQMKPGDPIDIFGPLGHGFDINNSLEYALFIAGGIGIAPLPYLAESLLEKHGSIPGLVLVGAKRAEQIVAVERFKKLGLEVTIYTEDRSLGERGCVTDDLEQGLKPCLEKGSMVFACGPTGMLAKVAERCSVLKIPCQVSLDRRMACGVGACQGCAVRVSQGSSSSPDSMYKRVCLDGPVFHSGEIMWTWMEEADRCPH